MRPLCAADYRLTGNIRYAHFPETVLDLLEPKDPALGDRPAVIVIHGGGWVGGSKEDLRPFCIPFLERGMVVADMDYRLAGVAPAPAAVSDVLEALAWVHGHAAELKIDSRRIVLAGVSAGAHLALLAGMLPERNEFGAVNKIAGILDFYGITDLSALAKSPGQHDFLNQWVPEQTNRQELLRSLSPISYARKDVPPVLAIHGDADSVVPIQQSASLVEALKQSGCKAELITVPGGQHGFTPQQDSALWPQIFKWFKKLKIV